MTERVTENGITESEYAYNGNGQRVKKWVSNGNQCTIFHYDRNGSMITESTGTGTIMAEYVSLNGQPLAKIEGNNIYYYPYGEIHTNSGTDIARHKFTGQIEVTWKSTKDF